MIDSSKIDRCGQNVCEKNAGINRLNLTQRVQIISEISIYFNKPTFIWAYYMNALGIRL